MKCYGDIESVNLSTGERHQRVADDGESRMVPIGHFLIDRRGGTVVYDLASDDILQAAQFILKGRVMHYRNGREAKNGDKVVSLAGYGSGAVNINAIGILFDATPGNDFCNGSIASTIGGPVVGACMCDCLHIDDLAELLKEKGLDKRPAGK